MEIYHSVPNYHQIVFLKNIDSSLNINIVTTLKNEDSKNFLRHRYKNVISKLMLDSGKTKDYKHGVNQEQRYNEFLIKCLHTQYDYIISFIDDYQSALETFSIALSIFEQNNISISKLLLGIKITDEDIFDAIEFAIDVGCNYIAISPDGCITKNKLLIFLKVKEKFPSIKLHILGSLNYPDLKAIKPFSADSSIATKYTNFNGKYIRLWNENNQTMENLDCYKPAKKIQMEILENQCKKLNINIGEGFHNNSALSMYNYYLMEKSLI